MHLLIHGITSEIFSPCDIDSRNDSMVYHADIVAAENIRLIERTMIPSQWENICRPAASVTVS